MMAVVLGVLACLVWAYLLLLRGGFWRAAPRDDDEAIAANGDWPPVVAIVPARDEAAHIGESVASLLAQRYNGELAVIVVDDGSSDGTAECARAAGVRNAAGRLTVITATPTPPGWTGKLWALHCGIDHAQTSAMLPEYLLLTDADIVHDIDSLNRLVGRARSGGLSLTSLMAKLRCESGVERFFVPAFIFFFQMLYPFPWVNRADRRTAAAAGGCMLVQRIALLRAGGVAAVRGELIDDCALARLLKKQAPVSLALTERVRSERRYHSVTDIRRMIGRSAYAQLRFSPLLLVMTTIGMLVTYIAPLALAVFSPGISRLLGAAAWILMAVAFQPTLRFHRISPLWGLALPAIAFAYLVFTLESAYQSARGRAGLWKGRVYAPQNLHR
ncbi:MAG TPA: glycosyltransferase [Casimicrobiaceae bacterium]|nr:glycosyltransferase [Casimicrobiaceae bacterium]